VTLLEGKRGLPGEIVFLSDGDAFIDLPDPGSEVIKYPAPFDCGFTKARYTVPKVLSHSNETFPEEFTLEVFNPLPDARSSNDLHKAWMLVGRVTALRIVELPVDWRPVIVEPASFIDRRFVREGVPVLEYVAKGWKAAGDAELKAFLSREKSYRADAQKRHAGIRKAVLGIMGLSAGALLCLAWWKRDSFGIQAHNKKG
jgi:hypothetical protein